MAKKEFIIQEMVENKVGEDAVYIDAPVGKFFAEPLHSTIDAIRCIRDLGEPGQYRIISVSKTVRIHSEKVTKVTLC